MESISLLKVILLLTFFSVVVNGYSSVRSHIASVSRGQSALRLSASLKPQLTKLIARQDLTTAETEVSTDQIIRSCISK